MNEQEDEGTGAVEVTEPSAEALRLARTIAQMRHPPLPVDLVVAAAKMIDELVAQEVQAALGHVEYIHMLESDDKADKAVEARMARIVAALEEFATQYPQSLGSGSTYALTAEMTLSKAIAIAREEG